MEHSRQRSLLSLLIMLTLLLAACTQQAPSMPADTLPATSAPAVAEAVPTTASEAPATEAPAPAAETAAPTEAEPTKATDDAAAVSDSKEAPMLAELVAAGKLPPLAERLPTQPCVGVKNIPADWIKPEIGRYGGTLRLVDYDQGSLGHDIGWLQNEFWLNAEGLQHDNAKVRENVLAGYEISPDAKVFTFKMREGMKYSDGTPFTTEDVEFWYKDILLNKDLTASIPQDFRAGRKPDGEPMKLEVIDKYAFTISFAEPYGGFLSRLTYGSPRIDSAKYLKQFHADYTPLEKLEPLIKEQGFEPGEWWRLFSAMRNPTKQHETGMPTYSPYVLKEMTATRAALERNPYYFKVDAAGNQLPYIDKLELSIVSDIEAATVKIVAGEVDLARRPVNAKSVPLYKEFEQERGYRMLLQPQHASLGEVFLNLTNPDPVWRQVVDDLRFRQALNYAIDRAQIIDAVYYGLAGMPRTIPVNGFDVDKANQLLDEMGLDKRDSDKWRLGPDGKRFVIPMELSTFTGEEVPVAEMVAKFWNNVGIATAVKTMDTTLFLETAAANETHMFTWWAHYPRWPWHESGDYVGIAWQQTYAPLWFQWYASNGKEGEEPPAEYVQLRQMQDKMFATPDVEEQRALWEQMKQTIADNVWWIPIVDDVQGPLIVNAKLGNVPEKGYAIENATAAEMFFFKE